MVATAEGGRSRHQGQERPHHQDGHACQFEPVDYLLHQVVKVHLESPGPAEVNGAVAADAPR